MRFLLALLENWKCPEVRGKTFGSLLTDLFQAFNCRDHVILIAEINAYGFSLQ